MESCAPPGGAGGPEHAFAAPNLSLRVAFGATRQRGENNLRSMHAVALLLLCREKDNTSTCRDAAREYPARQGPTKKALRARTGRAAGDRPQTAGDMFRFTSPRLPRARCSQSRRRIRSWPRSTRRRTGRRQRRCTGSRTPPRRRLLFGWGKGVGGQACERGQLGYIRTPRTAVHDPASQERNSAALASSALEGVKIKHERRLHRSASQAFSPGMCADYATIMLAWRARRKPCRYQAARQMMNNVRVERHAVQTTEPYLHLPRVRNMKRDRTTANQGEGSPKQGAALETAHCVLMLEVQQSSGSGGRGETRPDWGKARGG